MKKLFLTMVVILLTFPLATSASTIPFTVNAQANIFGSGHGYNPGPGGGGAGISPLLVSNSVNNGQVFEFTDVTGIISCGPGSNTADGGPYASGTTNIYSWDGISGIINGNATLFLVGVFLSDSEPANPAPDRLNFTGNTNFTDLHPLLSQVFFIGDGLTGNGLGSTQQFYAPNGATRLFLGFADAYEFGDPTSNPGYYNDNWGSLSGNINVSSVPEPTSIVVLAGGLASLLCLKRRKF